jgi:hypothetical protein
MTIEHIPEKHNYYIGQYRIVHIAKKWRICTKDPVIYGKWNFINTIEYNTDEDAINDLPEL